MQTTCSDCKFYQIRKEQLDQGFCRVLPAVSFALPTPKGIMIQAYDPGVGGERLACEKFQAKVVN